jgi:alkyl sulfatase BDS1-like metallo-beta-lactamase superfamily hydrolase
MADLLGLSSRIIDSGDATERTNRLTLELSELAPGIAMVEAFGHVVVFDSGEGLVVFDTSTPQPAEQIVAAIRAWSEAPLHTIVYTHGHVDHVGGAAAFLRDAEERGYQRPRIVAHENVPRRFDRYDRTNGYNAVINARQFGGTRQGDLTRPQFMTGFVRPDVTFEERMQFRAGNLTFELHHALGETDDHTWAWCPERRAICSGDLMTWTFPNAGNPQKVQRYPLEWAQALRAMVAKEPELLLPAHGLPIAGKERIALVLGDVASALEGLVEEVVGMMNGGARLDEVVQSVRVPEEVLARPWLQPVYDEPEFVVRNVWRLYGGWYDGNPAHLKPAADAELAAEMCRLAGGAMALARRGRELAEQGELRLASHLVEAAALAEPEDSEVHRLRAEVYEMRQAAETSLMARGIFRSAALDSREKAGK